MFIALACFFFIIGIILLSKSADLLIDAAISLAKHLKFSNVFIGLSVIAFGTSLPEFLVSLLALIQGSDEISIGNVIGSNIANVALILGWTGLIFTITFNNKKEIKIITKKLLILFLVYAFFIFFLLNGVLTRTNGLILLAFFFAFLFSSFKSSDMEIEIEENIKHTKPLAFLLTIGGIIGLLIGARMMTESAIYIARILGIREYVIGATIIAIGTSLPELAASAAAIKKGEIGMSIGNIIGSNIFNILMVIGTVSVILPIKVDLQMITFDLGIMLITSLILCLTIIFKPKIPKYVAATFAGIYGVYIIRLLLMAKS